MLSYSEAVVLPHATAVNQESNPTGRITTESVCCAVEQPDSILGRVIPTTKKKNPWLSLALSIRVSVVN